MTQLMSQGSVSIGHICPQQTDTPSTHSSPSLRLLSHSVSADGNRLLMPHIKDSIKTTESPLTPTSSMSPRSEDTMSPNANHQCLESATPQSAPNTPPTRPSPTPGSPTEFAPHTHPTQFSHQPATTPSLHPQSHHFISRHPQVSSSPGSPPTKQFVSSMQTQLPNGLTISTTTSPPPPTKTSFCIEALLSKGQRGPKDDRPSVVSQPTHAIHSDEQNLHHHRMMSAELAQRFRIRDEVEQRQANPTDDEEMQYVDERDYSPSPDEDGSR